MVQLATYVGAVDSHAPDSSGFAIQGGKATMPLYLLADELGYAPTPQDIQDAITQILGSVSTSVGDGRLQRTMPVAHPQYNWMYANAITSIKGIGKPERQAAGALLEVASLPNFALYPNYEFMVEFTPRPYVLAQDSSIPLLQNQTFYDSAGVAETSNYAAEWLRFTDWQYFPQFDNITCNLGFMKFRTQGDVSPGNGVQYTGQPRLFLPNNILKIWWSCVPYRYISSANSYISNLLGGVNQNDFTTWKVGSLQYVGYNPKRYTPPVQQIESQYMGASGLIYSSEKWCDIEFTFLRTTRTGTDVPTGLVVNGKQTNLNTNNPSWAMAGHNLQPWLTTRKYYYASTEDPTDPTNPAKQYPLWGSFPFELLFTDPDAKDVYKLPI